MKKYVKAITIRDMRVEAVSRTVYNHMTKYSVTYVNPDGFGGADKEYTDKNVPKRVLDFIESDDATCTCHTEGYDVFWRKDSPML